MGELVGDKIVSEYSGLYGYELRAFYCLKDSGLSLWQLGLALGLSRLRRADGYMTRLVSLGLVKKGRRNGVVLFCLTANGKIYLDYLISINGIPEHPRKKKRDQEMRVKRKYTKRDKPDQDKDKDILGLF